MESTLLSEYFREIRTWPATEAELRAACGWLSRLTGAPFTALYVLESDNESKVVFRLNNGHVGDGPGDERVTEFLRRQVSHSGSETGHLRHVQVDRGQKEFPWLASISHLSFISTSNPRKLLAFTGQAKAPSARDEVLLLSFIQHLSHLAEKKHLENLVSLRNQFLSIASHELKTPLTSIYGVLQLQERMIRLKKEDDSPAEKEKQHSFLKMMIRQVERLNELIDGLLDVSRIQSGRFTIDPAETDVAALVRELVSSRLAVIASDAGVRLNLDLPSALSAWVDPVRMEEIVTNLAMNAIRFSPEGGVVWFKVTDEPGAFRLTVRDQGPAVPMEDRERIFQPFERAQRTSRLGGLGLGLFISRQIALLHGGNVSLVESVPGKGNLFEAYMPRRNIATASA